MAMNFRPSDELATRLKTQADAEHVSVQVLLVKAAEDYLLRNAKRAMIDQNLAALWENYPETLRVLGEGA
jgi:predicted transcriptional regulator